MPDEPKEETHKHECPKCKHTWEHGESCFNQKEQHTCEKCGTEQYEKVGGLSREAVHALLDIMFIDFLIHQMKKKALVNETVKPDANQRSQQKNN